MTIMIMPYRLFILRINNFFRQFSFDRGQFVTPWITISDDNKLIS